MIPAVLILLAVAFVRLMASDRWPELGPIRSRWRGIEPRVVSHVRSAPGTYVYLFVLVITTWVLETSSASLARQLLLARSTNLHHLSRDPLRVLFSSAFWVSGAWQLFMWLVLFTAIVAPVERWLGTSRTAAVFFVGHVGATLLTAAGVWTALRLGLVESSIASSRDVGASYGFFAVAALFVCRTRGPRRLLYLAGPAAFIAIELAASPDFTAFGHLLAFGLGLASYPPIRKAVRSGGRASDQRDRSATVPGAGRAHPVRRRASSARSVVRRMATPPPRGEPSTVTKNEKPRREPAELDPPAVRAAEKQPEPRGKGKST